MSLSSGVFDYYCHVGLHQIKAFVTRVRYFWFYCPDDCGNLSLPHSRYTRDEQHMVSGPPTVFGLHMIFALLLLHSKTD